MVAGILLGFLIQHFPSVDQVSVAFRSALILVLSDIKKYNVCSMVQILLFCYLMRNMFFQFYEKHHS